MTKDSLLKGINLVEAFASTSKIKRLFHNPFKYIFSMFYSKLIYKYFNTSVMIKSKTFWGDRYFINFPSSIDIYLSGGKTHSSEIRLAKFLVNNLQANSTFIDVGAHYGYFSLLASQLIDNGIIYSIEASPITFNILKHNVCKKRNIKPINIALSDENATLEFLEFPTLFSEYNTLEKEQYKNEDWFNKSKVKLTKIPSQKGDTFSIENNLVPNLIKIDVEGAEDKVIIGLKETIINHKPIIIMEFCNSNRGNRNHIIADSELKKHGYIPYLINNFGKIEKLEVSTSEYVDSLKIESDNIVFKK